MSESDADDSGRHRGAVPVKHKVAKTVGVSALVLLLVGMTGFLLAYRHLEGNITVIDPGNMLGSRPAKVVVPAAPHEPLNILLLGSDTREGKGNGIDHAAAGARSDTTILLHISADRKHAYGVSIPRDTMVQRPDCGDVPGGFDMWNNAYAYGGPTCTQKQVEQVTGILVDHVVVVDFRGFRAMVDALGGVPVCVPSEVNDQKHGIYLPKGTYDVTGQQALSYVRERYILSANSDIGRMARQQAFLGAMAKKAISLGTLTNPVKLYKFLDAATKSLSTDEGLAHLRSLADLAKQLRGIGTENIQFLTAPFESYPPNPNRLQLTPAANRLWKQLRRDNELSGSYVKSIIKASSTPGGSATGSTESASPNPSKGPSAGASETAKPTQAQRDAAAENGLCA